MSDFTPTHLDKLSVTEKTKIAEVKLGLKLGTYHNTSRIVHLTDCVTRSTTNQSPVETATNANEDLIFTLSKNLSAISNIVGITLSGSLP